MATPAEELRADVVFQISDICVITSCVQTN